MDSVKNLRREDILNYYKRWCQPDNMVLAVFGDIEPQILLVKIKKELRKIENPGTRKQIIAHMRKAHSDRNDYRAVIVSSVRSEKNRWMEGKNVQDVACELGKSPEDTVLDLLAEERLRVGAIFMSMSEDNLKKILSHPLCMIGSDSSVRAFSGITARGKPHPRGFGSFPRFLGRYVREEGLMPLEDGLRRITSLPAETFGLVKRGLIGKGYYADIVLFDPATIMDRATYEDPFRAPEGIEYVIVNGKVVVREGELLQNTGAGMILRAGGRGYTSS